MKQLLDPLVKIAGVRFAALISHDGVPISCSEGNNCREVVPGEGPSPLEDLQAFSAIVAGWLGDVSRAVDPLTWDAPRRVVMSASRGSLVLCQGPGAVLVAMLENGISAEELRIPMDGALARMQRVLRGMGSNSEPASTSTDEGQPKGIFPSTGGPATGHDNPETTPASRVTGNNG